MIAKEVIRIDVDLLDDAAQSQLNDAPIISGRAPAAGFPSVHPFTAVGVFIRNEDSAPRLEKIFFLREELIVREDCGAADAGGCQIDETGGSGKGRFNCAHEKLRKTPNPKTQTPRKFQSPNLKLAQRGIWNLGIGVSLVLGVWDLGFHLSCLDTCCKPMEKRAMGRDISHRRRKS